MIPIRCRAARDSSYCCCCCCSFRRMLAKNVIYFKTSKRKQCCTSHACPIGKRNVEREIAISEFLTYVKFKFENQFNKIELEPVFFGERKSEFILLVMSGTSLAAAAAAAAAHNLVSI